MAQYLPIFVMLVLAIVFAVLSRIASRLLGPRNPTVQVAVSTLASGYVQDYALVLTGTFVSILPLLAVFLFLGRHIISGIMRGAVKG